MRKRFIRVAVFCALTAVAAPVFTGCSDYDDDIRSLQEQIDQVKELPHISTADMTAAINSAIETLQGQMETAIAGKADNSTVSELQQLVAELTTLANGKADASEVIALSDRINDLIEEVNGLDGTLNQKLTALQEEIGTLQENLAKAQEDLNAALKDKADASEISKLQETIAGINQTLAERLTEFNNVKEMAENNGEAIAEIQTQLTQLETLKSDISELQEANLEHIAKFQSLDTQLGGIDEEMDKLSARIEEVASSSATTETINSIISRIQALEDYKAQTLEALVSQANADHTWIENNKASLAQALTDISDLQSELSKYVTLESLQANYYDKEAVDKKFNALDATLTDLGLLKNMIQSVVYVPNEHAKYGQTMFWTLRVHTVNGWKTVKQNKTTKIQFRVSPAKFAENFADNYDVTFDGKQMLARVPSTFLKPTKITGDKTTGIVTMEVSTDIEQASVYAMCMKVTPKATNETDKNSDLTTNYFGVQHVQFDLAYLKTHSNNSDETTIKFDGSTPIKYSEGKAYYGKDVNGNNPFGKWDETDLAEIFGDNVFNTRYDFDPRNEVTNASFTINSQTGEFNVHPDAAGSTALIGRNVTPIAHTEVGGVDFPWPYEKVTVLDISLEETVYLNTTDFKRVNLDGSEWKPTWDGTFAWFKDKQKYELTASAYLRLFKKLGLTGDTEFFTFKMTAQPEKRAYFEVDKTNKKIYLVVKAGVNIDEVLKTKLTVEYGKTSDGAQRNYEITGVINPMTYNTGLTLTPDNLWWAGSAENGTVEFQPKRMPLDGQIEGIDFNMDLEKTFVDYTEDKNAVENLGGTVTANWNIANPTGTTVVSNNTEHTITIDKDKYVGGALSFGTAIKWGSKTTHTYKANILVNGLSGSWTAPADRNKTIEDRSKTYKVTGFAWSDYFGNDMWVDNKEQFGSIDDGYIYKTAPLTMWGLTAPTYKLQNPKDAELVKLNSTTGELSFTDEGRTWKPQTNYDIVIVVEASSRWGAISGYEGNNTFTFTLMKDAK